MNSFIESSNDFGLEINDWFVKNKPEITLITQEEKK
jgi:hypothetical protein